MEELNRVFATNLVMLRKQNKITQAELAEKLNYSDKAISKWERGEAIPDVSVLILIGQIFNVSLDYLVNEHAESKGVVLEQKKKRQISKNHLLITLVTLGSVWIFAVFAFVLLKILVPEYENSWLCFIYPIPVCGIISLVFNSVWKSKLMIFISISVIVWGILFSIVLSFSPNISWLVLLIGIPVQIVIILSSGIIKIK